ncbi:MAG TPA: hypothetical protein VF127_01735 [Nitrospira sp.]
MNRTSHTSDVFTLIGMMATIAGILVCLFFLFTPVTFGAMEALDVSDPSPDLQISMRWIQPILGQAIMEDALIRQRLHESTTAAPFDDGSAKLDHDSIQWVLGRVIVELSRSRMVGGLSAGTHQWDQRIVTIARHAAEQFQGSARPQDRMTGPAVLTF